MAVVWVTMSSIETGSSGVGRSLTWSSNNGINSDIRSMNLKISSIVPSLGDSISVLVESRDDIFDLFVTIN